MTCFWTGILQSLTDEDLTKLNVYKKTPTVLVQALKNKVVKTPNVTWNRAVLTNKELEENLTHIKNYDITSINNGYLCSSCEPFLLLLAELLHVNIHHRYLHSDIHYTVDNSDRTLYFGSDRGHFWSSINRNNNRKQIVGHNGVPGRPKGRAAHGHGRQPIKKR